MNSYNPTNVYMSPVVQIGIRQQLRSHRGFSLPGGSVLWKAVAKVLVVVVPMVLVANLIIASAVGNINKSIVKADNQRHELIDRNIEALASRAQLMASDNIRQRAGEKLSLYATSTYQVQKFDRKKGILSFF